MVRARAAGFLLLFLAACASSPFGAAETPGQKGYRLACRYVYAAIPAAEYVRLETAKPDIVDDIRAMESSAYDGVLQAVDALEAGSDTATAALSGAATSLSSFSFVVTGVNDLPTTEDEILERAPVLAAVALRSAARMRAWRVNVCQPTLEAMALGTRDPSAEEWAFMRAEMEKEHANVQP